MRVIRVEKVESGSLKAGDGEPGGAAEPQPPGRWGHRALKGYQIHVLWDWRVSFTGSAGAGLV